MPALSDPSLMLKCAMPGCARVALFFTAEDHGWCQDHEACVDGPVTIPRCTFTGCIKDATRYVPRPLKLIGGRPAPVPGYRCEAHAIP